jgi:hypothetical protein
MYQDCMHFVCHCPEIANIITRDWDQFSNTLGRYKWIKNLAMDDAAKTQDMLSKLQRNLTQMLQIFLIQKYKT